MSRLTLTDVRAFLEHLLSGDRRVELTAIPLAAAYVPVLDRNLAEIVALPPALEGGAPNAAQLEATDGVHDGHGDALYYLAKAYLASPSSSASAREAARWILAELVPSRRQLSASYATEAARARERRPRVTAAQPLLDRLPVEGGTAFAWATAFLDAGDQLQALLVGRADATPDRSAASILRGKAIAQIRRFREALADALEQDPARARANDQRFFGYLDLLESMRERGSADPTPSPPPEPAPAA